eukprot:4722438-Pyramimonas_sp.AAC.1
MPSAVTARTARVTAWTTTPTATTTTTRTTTTARIAALSGPRTPRGTLASTTLFFIGGARITTTTPTSLSLTCAVGAAVEIALSE